MLSGIELISPTIKWLEDTPAMVENGMQGWVCASCGAAHACWGWSTQRLYHRKALEGWVEAVTKLFNQWMTGENSWENFAWEITFQIKTIHLPRMMMCRCAAQTSFTLQHWRQSITKNEDWGSSEVLGGRSPRATPKKCYKPVTDARHHFYSE